MIGIVSVVFPKSNIIPNEGNENSDPELGQPYQKLTAEGMLRNLAQFMTQ